MSELWGKSAVELAAMIRDREVSSREVVQAHMADGLPVGVQVMGGKYTELRCLAVAEAIERRLGALTPIDPVTA